MASNSTSNPSDDSHGSKQSKQTKKRVCIVGSGCSGMSAAYALSLSPEKFDVTLFEKMPVVGGSATSHYLPNKDYYGAEYINDGVQGAR